MIMHQVILQNCIVSVQGYDTYTYEYFNGLYNVSKPVILDEVGYEGNISAG